MKLINDYLIQNFIDYKLKHIKKNIEIKKIKTYKGYKNNLFFNSETSKIKVIIFTNFGENKLSIITDLENNEKIYDFKTATSLNNIAFLGHLNNNKDFLIFHQISLNSKKVEDLDNILKKNTRNNKLFNEINLKKNILYSNSEIGKLDKNKHIFIINKNSNRITIKKLLVCKIDIKNTAIFKIKKTTPDTYILICDDGTKTGYQFCNAQVKTIKESIRIYKMLSNIDNPICQCHYEPEDKKWIIDKLSNESIYKINEIKKIKHLLDNK